MRPRFRRPIVTGPGFARPTIVAGKPVQPQFRFSGLKMTSQGPTPVYRYMPYPPPRTLFKRKI